MRESGGATPPGSPAPPTTTAYVPPGPITSTDTDGYGMPGKDVILPGTFSPGHSPGSALYGSLTLLDTSYLIMEIAGRNPGEFDHISVDGHLTFDGTLDLRLLNGFMPVDGDTFDLFDWGSVSGQFDHILVAPLDPGLAWNLSQLYITGAVSVVDPPVAAVPTPAALILIAVGSGVAVLSRRRRRG